MRMSSVIPVFLLLMVIAPAIGAVGVGDKAPDISAHTLEGDEISLSEALEDGPVYLVFWATWCPNCLNEIPKLTELHSHFKGKMRFIGINIGIGDSLGAVRKYRDIHEIDYDIVFDQSGEIIKAFGVLATPTQIIVSQKGVISYRDAAAPAIDNIESQWHNLALCRLGGSA
jgi:peroxiredoxin